MYINCFFLQAYRLEPLVNPLYSQVRPVKVDSAGSKISKEAVDHAEGMRQTKQQPQQQQQKSWWSSSLQNMGQSLISMATKKSSSPVMSERTQVPEKVSLYNSSYCYFVVIVILLFC